MTSGPLRVLMGNDHITFGGGGDAVLRFQRGVYEAEGHEVHTFSHGLERPPEANERDHVALEHPSVAVQKAGKFLFHPSTYRFLRRVLREVRPHLVHLHLISKYPGAVFAALRGQSVVQTLHGPNHFCATGWGALRTTSQVCELGIGAKCAARGCVPWSQLPLHLSLGAQTRALTRGRGRLALVMCPSRHLTRSVEEVGFGPARLVRNPIDRQFLEAPPAERPGPPTVLFAGALAEQKGVPTLVEAFATVRRAVPEARLVLAGRGPLEPALRERAGAADLRGSVAFRGFVGRDAIRDLYCAAHVLAVPSIWRENAPVVVAEGLACGLPCVGSDIGGIAEFVREGDCGLLAPPRDAGALAAGLVRMLTDDALRARCAANARRYAVAEFCPDRHAREILEIARAHARAPHDA